VIDCNESGRTTFKETVEREAGFVAGAEAGVKAGWYTYALSEPEANFEKEASATLLEVSMLALAVPAFDSENVFASSTDIGRSTGVEIGPVSVS
jgi:hypothetical protein